jgi:serine/threonine protein kinase
VREVAQALDHAYWSTDMTGQRLSVVHRDVSPHNIILSYDGAVKLLDFGVAMSAVTEHAAKMIVGKWLYMSPEATANGQIDHRSDLFSLGVILYLLCSGTVPFTGSEPREIVKKIRTAQYKPLQEVAAVPDRLALLVGRLLAPNPDDRPQRGQEVAAELADIARQYGFESSGASIAYILSQLFPNGASGSSDPQAPSIKEIVRNFGDDVSSFSTEKSSVSMTQSSMSTSMPSRQYAAMDVSQTFRQRTGPISVPFVPDVLRQADDTILNQLPPDLLPPEPRPPEPRPKPSSPRLEVSRLSQQQLPQQTAQLPKYRDGRIVQIVILVILVATAALLPVAAYLLGYI